MNVSVKLSCIQQHKSGFYTSVAFAVCPIFEKELLGVKGR